MRNLKIAFVVLVLSGCASSTKKQEPVEPPAPPRLNLIDIQNRLNLDIPPGQTGFKEKAFDACDLGPALSQLGETLSDCSKAYFTLIHLQLSCRPSEDSSSILSEGDLTPVQNQHLKWTLGKVAGESRTDALGQVVIREITSKSQKRSYLRVSTGVDFLVMRAGEATSVVTPPSWCGR